MSKYGKEIVIGAVPAVLIFLLFIGVNVVPLIFMLGLATVLYYFVRVRAGEGATSPTTRRKGRPEPAYLTFDEIGGQDRAKKELQEALDFLIHHDKIRQMGIRPLKGILLTGPPGTGKTLMAKASAHYTDSAFIAASGSEFVEMYVGVGAQRIRQLFKEVRQKAEKQKKDSCILFIDEIDVIGGKREGNQHKEYDQTLNQLLTEMDGIYSGDSPRMLIMAATNRKEMLDSALLRPGRFDRHIQVDLPDKKARRHILNIHTKNKPLDTSVDLDKVAEETFGFSGAQLESVANEAAIYAMREGSDKIQSAHFALAIDKVMMGEKTDRETTVEERQRVAIHELGHAIIAEYVHPETVAQVTLSPRGQALGYVRHNPQDDKYLYTAEYLREQIMICLGGAAAEELFYGGRSTGSRNDFEQALHLVRTMIESGMTELGIVDAETVNRENWGKESSRILNELGAETKQILQNYKVVFNQCLDILIKEEVLSGARFRELLEESTVPGNKANAFKNRSYFTPC